ncbi:MAG: SDR family NAD(P)-dependent oxidoreductase [Gammaproteobacteria bacterium]|nr:SDR family NAD(P)-dependent oxidoreductase [Gammaproteobacteria bacterium]MDX2461690.1 SDR family NAD(P)-dependent oxidoreductase [Gammaproteobacteria bacterium]
MFSPPTPLASFARPIVAIVNGASRGIGLAFVKGLLADSSVERVFATSRHGASDEVLAGFASGGNDRLRALDMDITVEASVAAAATAVKAIVGRVDLIVNCAGLLHDGANLQPEKRLTDVTPANLERSFAVNAIGPLLVAKHFQDLLHGQERAVFASLSARVGSIGDNRLGGWYGYRASKAAQNMITRNLSIELRRRARGIVCVALHPGTVDTGLSRPFQGNVPEDRLFSPDRAARHLLGVIDGLGPEDNGGFFAWDDQPIPW